MAMSSESNAASKGASIDVLVCTGNMGNAQPDLPSLNAWIPNDGSCSAVLSDKPKYPLAGAKIRRNIDTRKFDLIVIGMQEATFDVEDEDALARAEPLPPAGRVTSATYKKLKAVVDLAVNKDHNDSAKKFAKTSYKKKMMKRDDSNGHSKSERVHVDSERSLGNDSQHSATDIPNGDDADPSGQRRTDTQVLHRLFGAQLPSYHRIVSYQRGEMRLLVYSIIPASTGNNEMIGTNELTDLKVLSVKAQNTGKHGLANKGGIVAELLLNRTTRLAFLTAHLEAHEGLSKYAMRCSSLHDILRGTESTVPACGGIDASLSSHFTFVMGDLNFRSKLPEHEAGSDEHIAECHRLANAKEWSALNDVDELSHALSVKDCLVGFNTPPCNFPPTFKVLRQAGYEYKDNRSPSYTDRILYKASTGLEPNVRPMVYEPIDDFSTSDHKPIRGAFSIELNPQLKRKPVEAKRGALGAFLHWSKLGSTGNKESHRESLHLFISSMRCVLKKENDLKRESSPNTFICFVPTPTEAIQVDVSVWDAVFQRMGFKSLKTSTKSHDGSISRTMRGWPRTRKISGTYEPNWGDEEEVHFKVSTHTNTGKPIDLSGAILHLAVFDKKAKSAPKLVGSFPFNLSKFVVASKQLGEVSDHLSNLPSRRQMFSSSSSRWSSGPSSSLRDLFQKNSSATKLFGSTARKSALASLNTQGKIVENTRGSASSRIDSRKGPSNLEPVLETNGEQSESKEVGDPIPPPPPPESDDLSSEELPPPTQTPKEQQEEAGDYSLEMRESAKPGRPTLRELGDSAIFSSMKSWLGKSLNAPSSANLLDDMDIHSLQIDEPLIKNGKEIGRIYCTIDAWWLNDDAATAVESATVFVGSTASSRTEPVHSPGKSPSPTAMLSPATFSSRKRAPRSC